MNTVVCADQHAVSLERPALNAWRDPAPEAQWRPEPARLRRALAIAASGVMMAMAVSGAIAWGFMSSLQRQHTLTETGGIAGAAMPGPMRGPMLDYYAVESGKGLFLSSCSACHGADGH